MRSPFMNYNKEGQFSSLKIYFKVLQKHLITRTIKNYKKKIRRKKER